MLLILASEPISHTISDLRTVADKQKTCALCERERVLTFHHLIPKKTHKRTYVRNQFSKMEMQTRGIYLCKDCHRMVHRHIDHRTLALEYNTLEALQVHPELEKFISWVRKQRKRAKLK